MLFLSELGRGPWFFLGIKLKWNQKNVDFLELLGKESPSRQKGVQGSLQDILWAKGKILVSLNGHHKECACREGRGPLSWLSKSLTCSGGNSKGRHSVGGPGEVAGYEQQHSVDLSCQPAFLGSWLHHFWSRDYTFLCPSFLVCKMVMIMVPTSGCQCKNYLS